MVSSGLDTWILALTAGVLIVAVLTLFAAVVAAAYARRGDRRANVADPVAELSSVGPIREDGTVVHYLNVRNLSPVPVLEYWLWIESGGERVSNRVGAKQVVTLGGPPGGVPELVVTQPSDSQTLWIEWIERSGTHRRDTGIRPPRSG